MENIKTIEMVRCEITGKIVPASECEYVIIKILKHKDADINAYNLFGGATVQNAKELFSTDRTATNKAGSTDQVKESEDTVVLTAEELVRDRPKPVIPPAMRAFMTPNDTPGESITRLG